MEFSDEGTLFVGDNIAGAILTFDFTVESRITKDFEVNMYNIDTQISPALGTSQNDVQINDIAVHPFFVRGRKPSSILAVPYKPILPITQWCSLRHDVRIHLKVLIYRPTNKETKS